MPSSRNPRHIPNAVRRAVWKRDQGQCAFVSDSGHRCDARIGLELDHLVPVARGGTATADNIRLLCRAHNQYAADRTYGTAFMNGKREAARQGAACNPG
jgi:5-methylcytosine-specific restriction endonuclease McrA